MNRTYLHFQQRRRSFFRRIAGYFIRGLLFVIPVGLSIYFITQSVRWLDNLIKINVGFYAPGMGIIVVLVGITLIGMIFTVSNALYNLLDEFFSRVPIIRLFYTSVKDMTEAFVGDKKKFHEPVLVDWGTDGTQRIGFVTQNDLSQLGIHDKVAVYFPFSYAITGELFMVPPARIHPMKDGGTEIMKFIVSGGITGLEN